MNVAVKTLNSLDPPVSAMELVFVRMVSSLCRITHKSAMTYHHVLVHHMDMLRLLYVSFLASLHPYMLMIIA